jgi:hypothetical protein
MHGALKLPAPFLYKPLMNKATYHYSRVLLCRALSEIDSLTRRVYALRAPSSRPFIDHFLLATLFSLLFLYASWMPGSVCSFAGLPEQTSWSGYPARPPRRIIVPFFILVLSFLQPCFATFPYNPTSIRCSLDRIPVSSFVSLPHGLAFSFGGFPGI